MESHGHNGEPHQVRHIPPRLTQALQLFDVRGTPIDIDILTNFMRYTEIYITHQPHIQFSHGEPDVWGCCRAVPLTA